MDLSSLVFEGVKNSIEAGAMNVDISVSLNKTRAEIIISDDGVENNLEEPFKRGTSTKGENRGLGLYEIRKASEKASLVRENGITTLKFLTKNDGTLTKVEELLFPIFQMDSNIKFTLAEEGGCTFSISSEELEKLGLIPITALEVKNFKAWINEHRS